MPRTEIEIDVINAGHAISPIDGRYREKVEPLADCFSEFALMRYRYLVEIEYLIAFTSDIDGIRALTVPEKRYLRNLYESFDDSDYLSIKKIEGKTNHDVNAVVRYLKEILKEGSMADLVEFVHLGLTSEDINNLAFAFMLKNGVNLLYEEYQETRKMLYGVLSDHKNIPLLARTHGQPASPTTVGWEENVFEERLFDELQTLQCAKIKVKFGGATGGHNALYVAKPEINWRDFSQSLIGKLNQIGSMPSTLVFVYNPYTTQIEPHDTYAVLFDKMRRLNTILIDYACDMWGYISRDVFTQKPVQGEDGSSAMPNKVNPIDFENAEGNLKIANVLFNFFADTLPISRYQRHLTDSTIIRNFGTAFAHTLIALKALQKGMGKVYVNTVKTNSELENSWSVVAEAYQTIFRLAGVNDGYDLLKDATRGKAVTKEDMHNFIDAVASKNNLAPEVVEKLKKITPQNYIGDRRIVKKGGIEP